MRFLLSVAFLLLLPVHALSEDKGKQIYDQWCAQCHGYEGKGDGYAAEFIFQKPRDFTVGTFKFTSTPSGDPPTDEDLIRMIRKGNQGTSMPAWTRFTDEEVRALAEHIKKFAPDIFSYKPEPIKISKAPACTAETIGKGARIYKEVAKCWECHGEGGRGDGKKSWDEKFKDDWGNRIYAGNQTHPWEYKRGSSLEDIYIRITTGNKGTPMTSYQDALTDDEERWALACFVESRQLRRKLGVALRVKKVDAMPSATDDKIWEQADYLDIPLAGQIIFEPRHFAPGIANVRVRGVYAASEVAILLEWTDKQPNQGGDGLPPDAIRVKFPSKLSEGAEKPHFYLGDKKREVEIWQWKASDGAGVELNAKGFRDVARREKQDIKATWTYEEGLYRVIFFKRALDAKEAVFFEAGKFIPFSVGLYDGREKEEENKGSISAWYYIMLEPPTPLKAYVLPPVVFLAVLGLGMLLHKRLRRGGRK